MVIEATVKTGITVYTKKDVYEPIYCSYDADGDLRITQSEDVILIPAVAVARFKRAILNMEEVS